jgi:hypothetical protein
MDVWLIWLQTDDHTWLEAAWDDETTAENHSGWTETVDRCRRLAYEERYEMRIQRVTVPGVFALFEPATAKATEVE